MGQHFGLIGYPLGHSFSQGYFQKKFEKLGLVDNTYSTFELSSLNEFPRLIQSKKLAGLNVTIPYKQDIISYLDSLDVSAEKVDAVNVIKFSNDRLIGYNTDYPAFKKSLRKFIGQIECRALVLGTGGASKAVIASLEDLSIEFHQVSRIATANAFSYEQIMLKPEMLEEYKLIINTTPLGMSPNLNTFPSLPYENLTSSHFLFDLVYNPEITMFLKKGKQAGSQVKNGLEMLHLQADLAWDIWNA